MLFLIDLQNDYLDPQGKFYFPETKDLIQALLKRIREAQGSGEPILYTLNLYTDKDERPIGEREWASSLYEPFRELLQGELPLNKYYYGISSEEAGKIMACYKEDAPSRIEVAGVETDLCVMANAVIIQNMFPDAQIVVSRSRSRSSHHDLEEKSFAVMEGMKMEIID